MTKRQSKRLKPGDLVLCCRGSCSSGAFTKGKIYEVGGKFYTNPVVSDHIAVKYDNFGEENGLSCEYFIKVKNKKATKVLFRGNE